MKHRESFFYYYLQQYYKIFKLFLHSSFQIIDRQRKYKKGQEIFMNVMFTRFFIAKLKKLGEIANKESDDSKLKKWRGLFFEIFFFPPKYCSNSCVAIIYFSVENYFKIT